MGVINGIVPLILVMLFVLQPCKAVKVIILDGLTEWKTTTLHIRDSLIIKHQNAQNLYLFHSRRAFELCMLDEATLVSKEMFNTVKWHSVRPGYYYFATMNEKSQTNCENSEKVSVRVIIPDPDSGFPSLPSLPTPAPVSGGDDTSIPPSYMPSSSPSSVEYEGSGPVLPRSYIAPTTAPMSSVATDKNSRNIIPFISSNPAVPIPIGETDSATIQQLPTPTSQRQVSGMGSCIGVESYLLMIFVIISSFVIVDDRYFYF